MKTEPMPEIVEIIDDDDDRGFRGDGGLIVDQTAPPARRLAGPAAAVLLLAVVGYAVVSGTVSSDPAALPTPGLITPQYYVAEPPTGFEMYLAESRSEPGIDPATFESGRAAELWATSDATATSGSWFVVSRGSQHSTGRNSYRRIVDDMEVLFEHDPASRQTRLSFTKDGTEMAITAFGWIDRQLVRLLRSVNVDDSAIRFSDGFFTGDHKRILLADPASALFGLPAARVGYTTGLPAELAESFTITVAGDNINDEPLVAAFALTGTTTFAAGEHPAIIGPSAADPTVNIAQWHDGERLITLRGNLEAWQLVAIAQTVHESSISEVRQQLQAGIPPTVEALQASPRTVVGGRLKDGRDWLIQVSERDSADPGAGYLWWIGQPDDTRAPADTRASLPGDAPSIDTFVEDGRTYILASIPRSMDGAELHVAPTGLPSIVTRLRDVDPALPGEFAASVFTQPVPFTARILDSDGNILAFWPSI
jgi:hypothetical protein